MACSCCNGGHSASQTLVERLEEEGVWETRVREFIAKGQYHRNLKEDRPEWQVDFTFMSELELRAWVILHNVDVWHCRSRDVLHRAVKKSKTFTHRPALVAWLLDNNYARADTLRLSVACCAKKVSMLLKGGADPTLQDGLEMTDPANAAGSERECECCGRLWRKNEKGRGRSVKQNGRQKKTGHFGSACMMSITDWERERER